MGMRIKVCYDFTNTYIENEDLEYEGEEDVPRLPHDAHLHSLLDLQGHGEQDLG